MWYNPTAPSFIQRFYLIVSYLPVSILIFRPLPYVKTYVSSSTPFPCQFYHLVYISLGVYFWSCVYSVVSLCLLINTYRVQFLLSPHYFIGWFLLPIWIEWNILVNSYIWNSISLVVFHILIKKYQQLFPWTFMNVYTVNGILKLCLVSP